ncbi:aminotransferase class I/II-fold pyridoxal phosphate-dependent enzyme [Hydrogenovibrio sp. 3SP14C1]|uniref:aminotransferase class I/II-fold pyridoxal phosphate-dependent enzyme n=1 Tax=Hydrogenovibrio sp. 3SP14C1 TaxID=3038774 RepID=UPI002415A39A|nr:aminotransferase class I/II-fold pyridoxal phosphate-dependent enzyme [Hydrogenovibrio sp. 3SP14C1]MDG4812601.1 aminotransferase class I/II-fold pyridoxal phosphate-dependent enzyme [Hydrogenovibrio sp. 3SP14C1]
MTDFTTSISDQAKTLQPFRVMKILGEAKALEQAGRDIIHMEIGEPDFESLESVHTAVKNALDQGKTHYTPTLGLPELRQKLSAFYASFYHAKVKSENIMLTPGSSSALQLALTALLNPEDKVLMSDPTYPCNRQFVQLLHGQLVLLPVDADSNYQLTLSHLQTHWQEGIKVVMVASPANPSGTVIEQDELIKMAKFAATKNAYFLVDEIYQGLVYERPPESILSHSSLPENVIVINSFSKFFNMTGWRLGWLVAPSHLMSVLERLGQNLFLSAPTPSQYGALRVLDSDALTLLEERRKIFENRRNTLFQAMEKAGIAPSILPQGAFYLYWDVSNYTDDSEQFCSRLLAETGVALTPGTDFGTYKANRHVRLAYTTTEDQLKKAVQKISAFIETSTL